MIDEHRTFRSCIFCGCPGSPSKEHIFGKTLAKRFREKFSPAQPWLVRTASASVKGNGPILSIAPPVACEPCNNGELSRDIAASLTPLWAAIQGETFMMSDSDQKALSRYWERVGLIADVMTSSYHISDEYRSSRYYARSQGYRQSQPLFSEDQRRAWLRGDLLPGMHVYVGHHRGVLGLNPITFIAPSMETRQQDTSMTVCGKRFLMVVGHLAVCVRMGTDWRNEFPIGMQNLSDDVVTAHWPPAVDVTYEDFLRLPNQTPDIRFASWYMRRPEWREQVEQHSQKVGAFEPPASLLPQLQREWQRTTN